jgi:AbrB family looped-hinge helix DNA binding protein
MKVTTKGQVTIPQDIREQLGLHPGAEVEFFLEGKGARMLPVKKDRRHGKRVVARLRGKGTVKLTTEQIMALTRGE